MHIPSIITALCLPFLVSSTVSDGQRVLSDHSKTPSIQKKLFKVISDSPFLTLHKDLCEIQSISNNELEIGRWLTKFLEAHNFTVTRQKIPPLDESNGGKARWNIYASPKASHSESSGIGGHTVPKVLLSSHIDTVPPFIPYSLSLPESSLSNFRRENILVSGRGTVDAKACVAAQIVAVMDLVTDADLDVTPSDLALLFVVGEEVRGDGMLSFSNSSLYHDTKANYKAVIFGEPTESKLATGHKGISSLYIRAYGKAAHSGYPWLGKSANSMILPALLALDGLGDIPEDEGGLPSSDRFGRTTVNVGYIAGGVAANVVPAYAEAKAAFRLAAGTLDSNKDIIMNAIKSADPDGLLDCQFTQGYGPVYMDGGVPGFQEITVNYGTDVPNLVVDAGVKRYLYGPGSILVAHGADEGLTVGELEKAVADYKKLVKHALKL